MLPLDDRLIERLTIDGPPGSVARLTDFTFRPGATHVPDVHVPAVANRSFTVEVDLERHRRDDDGVLVRHGSVSSGYVLFVADGRAVLEHNRFGTRTRLAPDVDLGIGTRTVAFSFDRTGALLGTFALAIDGVERARTEPVRTVAVTLGANFGIGADHASPVSFAYAAPAPFGGDIHQVRVRLADDAAPVTIFDLID